MLKVSDLYRVQEEIGNGCELLIFLSHINESLVIRAMWYISGEKYLYQRTYIKEDLLFPKELLQTFKGEVKEWFKNFNYLIESEKVDNEESKWHKGRFIR